MKFHKVKKRFRREYSLHPPTILTECDKEIPDYYNVRTFEECSKCFPLGE